ncbi:MAG: hypothetical protein E7290_12515 [Lachnospiraceae bacterium]|nr:hypothetical protein [Lachnospiraceae bacterium]
MITDYDFYTGKYFGDIIPETSLEKYLSRAEDSLQELTFGRLQDLTEFDENVQKAVCALAEVEYQIDMASKATMLRENGSGGMIKSKSSGGESISYDVGNNLIYSVLNDEKAQGKLKYNTARKYLRGSGLLYAGVE